MTHGFCKTLTLTYRNPYPCWWVGVCLGKGLGTSEILYYFIQFVGHASRAFQNRGNFGQVTKPNFNCNNLEI